MERKKTFITSHSFRRKRANDVVARSPERISVFGDREALVEYYLIEDIIHLYEYRLKQVLNDPASTKGGKIGASKSAQKYTALLNIFKTIGDLSRILLHEGNYTAVRTAIHERALMRAAGKMKYIAKMKNMAIDIARSLSQECLDVWAANTEMEEEFDIVEMTEEDLRTVRGLPSQDEVAALIRELETAIPDDAPKKKPSARLV